MNRVFLLFLLFLPSILLGATYSVEDDVFPKASQIPGGAEKWIVSGVTKAEANEGVDRCNLYENTYVYFSDKRERKFEILRSKSYMASVRIYDCDNLDSALNRYNALIKITKETVDKRSMAPIPVGEEGLMVAVPFSNSNNQQANYYVTYILKNFVVQVYSDDGFAQMDISGIIEKNIIATFDKLGLNHALNRINIKIHPKISDNMLTKKPNLQQYATEVISFAGNDISHIKISGNLVDYNHEPIKGARIECIETGDETTTDRNGKYELLVTGGKDKTGKTLSIDKSIIYPEPLLDLSRPIITGIYEVEFGKPNNLSNKNIGIIDIVVKNSRISGFYIDSKTLRKYPLSGITNSTNTISFDVNCSDKYTNIDEKTDCKYIFHAKLSKDILTGKVTGSKNDDFFIDLNKLNKVVENVYARDNEIILKPTVFESMTFNKHFSRNEMIITPKSYLSFSTQYNSLKDLAYLTDVSLVLKVSDKNIKEGADLYLFERQYDEENRKVILKKHSLLERLYKNKDLSEIIINITPLVKIGHENDFLIGILNSNEDDYIILDYAQAKLKLEYYRDNEKYSPEQVLSFKLKTFEGEDIVSNKGKLERDGQNDIVLSLIIRNQGRIFDDIEVIANGISNRKWNTKINDIYPLVGVIKNGKPANNLDDGSIKLLLTKDIEFFDIHLFKGSLLKEDIKTFTVRVRIDGQIYEKVIWLNE